MNNDRNGREETVHREISSLIPWYVNGTLDATDRKKVDAHRGSCAACRYELLQERHVYQQMTSEVGVEYMAGPSLKRLQSRLDELETGTSRPDAPATPAPTRSPVRPWWGLLAASIVVMAVALSLLAGNRWLEFRAGPSQAAYHTVTTRAARSPDEVIRAVFSPAITLVELQTVLKESQLKIISGPTEAGVYSLAATSTQPVDSSLAALRRHATVRFAESTQPVERSVPEPGASR
jgi:hypothetical protein